jgi:16S rRNA G966 N2-methylase RsmD
MSDQPETPPDALNALADLLEDVLEGLTMVELFARRGTVSSRFLSEGVERAVCITEDPPEDRAEQEGLVWLPMDPVDCLSEQRVQNVGLVYSKPPYESEKNKEVLEKLPDSPMIAENCLVILEEATWSHTRIEDFGQYQKIEDYEFDDVKITVTQMLDEPTE